jgi:integrase/recombinase XerD
MNNERMSARKKARELLKYFRNEQPDYNYVRSVFKFLREDLELKSPKPSRQLPVVPTEDEIKRYYNVVWNSSTFQDMMIIKTLLYTGVRVSELINIKINDIDFQNWQIRINKGKGDKDRIVPFPELFKELMAMHADNMRKKNAVYLFESNRKKKYTDRGIRKILARYAGEAGINHSISPHQMRHFLFTWLKKQGIDDALIQPYSGHESRKTLEIYSKLSITEAQEKYNEVIKKFPI